MAGTVIQGWEKKGFEREITIIGRRNRNDASRLLPRVHRIASLLKRWLLGTHQGAVASQHLPYYLDEFTFRFNRRRSKSRGKLFFRLMLPRKPGVHTVPNPSGKGWVNEVKGEIVSTCSPAGRRRGPPVSRLYGNRAARHPKSMVPHLYFPIGVRKARGGRKSPSSWQPLTRNSTRNLDLQKNRGCSLKF
jgi:ISXO2-like transposase domain